MSGVTIKVEPAEVNDHLTGSTPISIAPRRIQGQPVLTFRKLCVPPVHPKPKPNNAVVKSLVEYLVKQNETVLSNNDATRLKPATRQLLRMSGVPMTTVPSAANDAIPQITIPIVNRDKLPEPFCRLDGKLQIYRQCQVTIPDGGQSAGIDPKSLRKPLGALIKPPETMLSKVLLQCRDEELAVPIDGSPRITSATTGTTTSNPMLAFDANIPAAVSDISNCIDRTTTDARILLPINPTNTGNLKSTDAPLFSQSMVSMAVNNNKSNELLNVNSVDLVCGVAIKALLENQSNSLISLDMVYYFCNFCTFKTGDKNEFVCHVASHKFLCTYCDYQSLSRAKIINHMVENHKQFSGIAENIEYCALLHDYLKRTKVNCDEVDDFELPTTKTKSVIPKGYESVPVKVGHTLSKSTATVISMADCQYTVHTPTPLIPVTPHNSGETVTTNLDANTLLTDISNATSQSKTVAKVITDASSIHSFSPCNDANPSHSTVSLACHGCNFVTQDLSLFNLHAKSHDSKLQKPLFMVIPRELAQQIKSLDGIRKTHVESGDLAYLSQSVVFDHIEKPDENVYTMLEEQNSNDRTQCDVIIQTDPHSDDGNNDDNNNGDAISISDTDPILELEDVSAGMPDATCISLPALGPIVEQDDISMQETLSIHVADDIVDDTNSQEDVSVDGETNAILESSDVSVNQTDMKDVRCYECFNCHGQTLDLDTMASHLRRDHVGHYFIAVDLRAKKLKKARYVMFCGKDGCPFFSKNAEKYYEHSTHCTPQLTEFGCILDSAGRTIEFAKKIFHKINKDSYSCHNCDFKSFYITQVHRHLSMNHESQEPIIMYAKVGFGDRPTIRYICGICVNYKTSKQTKLSLHIRVRHGKKAEANEPVNNTIEESRMDKYQKQFQEPLDIEIHAANDEAIIRKRRKRDGSADADFEKLMDDYLNQEAESMMMSATKRTRHAAMKAQVRLTGDPPTWFKCNHCEFCCLGVKMIRQHMLTKHTDKKLRAVDLDKKGLHKPSNMHICPDENCTFMHWAEDALHDHISKEHSHRSVSSIVADIDIKVECETDNEGSNDYGNETSNNVDNEDSNDCGNEVTNNHIDNKHSNDDNSDDGSVPNIINDIDIQMECDTVDEDINGCGNEVTNDADNEDSNNDSSDASSDDSDYGDEIDNGIKEEKKVDCNDDGKGGGSVEVDNAEDGNHVDDVQPADHEINAQTFDSNTAYEHDILESIDGTNDDNANAENTPYPQ